MIRNLMLAAGLFTFTAGSALAAEAPGTRNQRIAQAGQTTATDTAKEPGKKAKRERKGKKKDDERASASTRRK